jgi:hypothetical protein
MYNSVLDSNVNDSCEAYSGAGGADLAFGYGQHAPGYGVPLREDGHYKPVHGFHEPAPAQRHFSGIYSHPGLLPSYFLPFRSLNAPSPSHSAGDLPQIHQPPHPPPGSWLSTPRQRQQPHPIPGSWPNLPRRNELRQQTQHHVPRLQPPPARQSLPRAPHPTTLSTAANNFVPGAATHESKRQKPLFICVNRVRGCITKRRHTVDKCRYT